MRKATVMAVAAMVAAMSLGLAAPAHAQCPSGVPALPTSNTVKLENGQVRINPGGPTQDVDVAGDYANDRADEGIDCALGVVPGQVWCAAFDIGLNAVRFMYYVYQDPNTGEIVIDYARIVADVNNCV